MKLYKKKKVITRGDNVPYLVRYSVFDCKWFAIKVHNLLKDDDACEHCHPWKFLTFILSGGYIEHTPTKTRYYGRFSLLYRPATYVHRLEIPKPMWTFVITFKKVREWGFYTKYGWVPWFKYTSENQCDL